MTEATPLPLPLPLPLYRDPDAFRYEGPALFGPAWQMLAPDEALAEPGAYMAVERGGWSILAARGEDGVLRAFHNVGADSGVPLIALGAGKATAFHAADGRGYGLDGSPRDAGGHAVPSPGLRPLAVGSWRGIVLAAAVPPPYSLEESLVSFEIPVPDIGAGLFTAAGTAVTDIACGWKTFLDFGRALESPAGMPADSFLGIAVANRKGCILRNIDPDDPDSLWAWIWPGLGIHRSRQGVVLSQLIVNGGQATRLVRHVYLTAAGLAQAPALTAAWLAIAERQKAAAEAAQASLDAGAVPPVTPSPTPYGLHRIVGAVLDPKGWDGFRPFVVDRTVRESANVTSIYLKAADGGRLPPFRPGQYLTCRLTIPGRDRPVLRNYTLSNRPGADHYRLTVKREPGGGASQFLCAMAPGDRLEALMARGSFRLDDQSPLPAVLLSAGVGVTPMVSMLAAIAAAGGGREAWFVHGARHGAEHALADEVRALAAGYPGARLHVLYSQPRNVDALGRHYDAAGRLTIDRLRDLLPGSEADFYLCGPMDFMRDLYRGLRDWGVPKERIHHEFFAVAEAFEPGEQPAPRPPAPAPAEGDPIHTVTFARSGVRATWTPAEGSILELAETYGVNPPFSCRDGECMVCLQVVLDGEVQYWRRGDDPREPGCELLCCAFPKTDLVVDI